VALHQDEAILLAVTDLQEADRIVEFLTRHEGKRRGVARGAKRRFSRFAGELQPLAKARIGWFEKEGRDLVRISSVELLRAPKGLTGDLEGILLGSCLAEQMATFAQEGEPAETLFRLLDSTVEALERGTDRALAARYFEAWLLRLAGLFPAPADCPRCGRPLEEGAALEATGEDLVCAGCAGPASRQLSAAALSFLDRISRENLARLSERPPATATLAEVEEIAGRIRRHFLGHELKSYVVASQTLARLSGRPERREGR
jgi:DNA repair protein RecO (recombination protein O)